MGKSIKLPVIHCPDCKADINLDFETSGRSLRKLTAACIGCPWELDLLEETRGQYAVNRDRAKRVTKEVSRAVAEARHHLPSDRDEWGAALRNPRHPFTAAVLAGVVLVAMELSGFGIFMAVAWILGNLILNPLGWVLVPLVVAVAFMYRDYLRRDRLETLKHTLDDLDQQRESGTISAEQHRQAKRKAVEDLVP